MRFIYPPISFHNSKGNRNNLINTLYEQLVNNFRNFYSLLKKENEFFLFKTYINYYGHCNKGFINTHL